VLSPLDKREKKKKKKKSNKRKKRRKRERINLLSPQRKNGVYIAPNDKKAR